MDFGDVEFMIGALDVAEVVLASGGVVDYDLDEFWRVQREWQVLRGYGVRGGWRG